MRTKVYRSGAGMSSGVAGILGLAPRIAAGVFAAVATGAAHAQWDYKDWTAQYQNINNQVSYAFTNTSAAGTISGLSIYPGFAGASSCSVPTAITLQNSFTTELQIHGTSGLGSSLDLTFSNGYAWGSGGRLIIGNIHNGYEYTLSAWDFSNQPINTNSWLPVAGEYPSNATGSAGYFSTSLTSITSAGLSTRFSVMDTSADPNFGQGGVLNIGGLVGVGKIRLTLTNSSLVPNAQQVDWLIFNVGTPVPSPGVGLATCSAGLLLRRRRR